MKYLKIASFNNNIRANIVLGMLLENNIDCYLDSEASVSIDPLINPSNGGNLLVAETDIVTAKNLLIQNENEYLKEFECLVCKSHSLSVEEKIEPPLNFWNKLHNIISYGQTNNYSKKYRCQNCKSLFTELPSPITEE